MKAVVYEKYGPPEVLQIMEIEKPVPKNNELLVKVSATTVSYGAMIGRKGKHPDSRFFTLAIRLIYGIRKPRKPILGYEFAGIVESVGKDVTLFKKGDEVFGTTTMLDAGSYAEYVCVPEKWKQGIITLKPKNMAFEEAAALPIGGMTALYLLKKVNIQKEQKILIYGASGSVGSFAVQLAKYFGAEVTAVCSTSKIEMVKSLGADKVIDYTKEDFTEREEKYDVVFEAVSKLSAAKCKKALKQKGIFLSVKSPTYETVESINFLKKLAEEGKIRPYIDKNYTLEQIVEAHRYADEGHKKGNIVITVKQSGEK